MTQRSCKERWKEHKDSRMADLRRLWKARCEGEDSPYHKRVAAELGDFHEYGLSLDYVAPGTFRDQKRGYWRYQISWGGPGEEFRFYGEELGEYKASLDRVTFVFLDLFDGHERVLVGKDAELMEEIFQDWAETGTLHYLREEALR